MLNIHDYDFIELEKLVVNLGVSKFRTKQIWDFLYNKNILKFSDMQNLDDKTIKILEENFYIKNYKEVVLQESTDGTKKALLSLNDGEKIETVLMKYRHGYSVCVTTQVGCRIGCSFCASHLGGFKRNLTAGEIVSQIKYWICTLGVRISNVVVMGIGEPFDNLDHVLNFITICNDSRGYNIGARKFTVSTSGILDKMEQFTNYDKQVNLAISVHASNNEIRSKIMKINNKYSIEDILSAVKIYQLKTNRQVTFEYIMLEGINDKKEHARELAGLIGKLDIHINLIPYNNVFENSYDTTKKDKIEEFAKVLIINGASCTIRSQKGNDIDGACGQLRYKKG